MRSNLKLSNDSKHIVVIRLSAMGDVAIAIPVLRHFKNNIQKLNLQS